MGASLLGKVPVTSNGIVSSSLLVNLACLMRQPTGISTYVVNLFPYLQPLAPTLLMAAPSEGFTCHPIPAGMTAESGTQGHLRRLLWTQFQLPALYRHLQANLLFSPIPEAPLWAGCRSIVMVHDLIPLRFPRWRSPLTLYSRYIVPLVLQEAQHIITNSVATAEDVSRFYGIPAQKLTPIPLAYDADHFRWLDLPTSNYFLYVGRLDPYKNVQQAIAAFAALSNHTDYELWIAGPPDRRFRPALQAKATQLGVAAQVKFLNYLPYADLPTVINQAIALVFPTLWEGFGLPVLEAMACGTPVITSNLASLPEVTGEAAILVNPTDTGAIADAMQALASDSALREQLRQAGLKQAQQFSWGKTGQATVDVLQRFL
jgi:glycosyltransferase involved in cell wall biosynthesis